MYFKLKKHVLVGLGVGMGGDQGKFVINFGYKGVYKRH
jgi:hypothetical protein